MAVAAATNYADRRRSAYAYEGSLDDSRRRDALRICDYYRRGILTADEACRVILFSCVEPPLAAEYVGLLSDDLRAALAQFLPTLPASDEGWARFEGVGQFDGDECSWARLVVECRASTEATRACMLVNADPPAAADFVDRVRAAYRQRKAELCREIALRQQYQSTPDRSRQ